MTDDVKEHSDLVGGSSARRRLHCAGSYRLTQKIPEAVRNQSSPYADEGTVCHHVVEQVLLENYPDPEFARGKTFAPDGEGVFGIPKLGGPVEMDDELMNAVWEAIDLFDALDKQYADEGGLAYRVEERCAFPGIEGAFGTTDIVASTTKRTIVLDWKFGAGVDVHVVYHDEVDGEVVADVNEQLLFYATASRNKFPEMFRSPGDTVFRLNWPIDLYIVQPRSRTRTDDAPIFSKTTVYHRDLDAFAARLQAALPSMLAPDAPAVRGDWCKFCPATIICPAKMEPLPGVVAIFDKLEKRSIGKTTKLHLPTPPPEVSWDDMFGDLLDMAFALEPVIAAIQEAGHVWLDAGHKINGWKLVDKRATEKYVDPDGAKRHALGLGVPEHATMTDPELKSPAQLADAMEQFMPGTSKTARTKAARADLSKFTEKKSSGTTLAVAEDPRPTALSAPALLMKLSGKLQLLQKG